MDKYKVHKDKQISESFATLKYIDMTRDKLCRNDTTFKLYSFVCQNEQTAMVVSLNYIHMS